MSEDVLSMFFTQVPLIGQNYVDIGNLNGIKDADSKSDVPCRERGTLDPLTLLVKREHHCCFTS